MYSNTIGLLLVSAMEKASGKTWATLLCEEVLRPLHLHQTRISEGPVQGLAKGYQYGDATGPAPRKGAGEVLHDVSSDSPSKWAESGNLVSNLSDLRRFGQALFKGRYLNAASMVEMRQFVKTGYPVDYRYGFCLSAMKTRSAIADRYRAIKAASPIMRPPTR